MSIQGEQGQALRHTSSQEGHTLCCIVSCSEHQAKDRNCLWVSSLLPSPPARQLLALQPIFYSFVPLPPLDNIHTESRISIGMGIWSPTKKSVVVRVQYQNTQCVLSLMSAPGHWT